MSILFSGSSKIFNRQLTTFSEQISGVVRCSIRPCQVIVWIVVHIAAQTGSVVKERGCWSEANIEEQSLHRGAVRCRHCHRCPWWQIGQLYLSDYNANYNYTDVNNTAPVECNL